jgi:hypothetical protein
MRRIILIIATLLASLAFASPAMASGSGHAIKPATQHEVNVNNSFNAYIAETFGALCVDTGGVVQGNYAYNGNCPGRTFTFRSTGHNYNDPQDLCPIAGCPTLCSNPSTCSHWILINNYASDTTEKTVVLSGDSIHGDRVVPDCWQCTAGQLQQWDLLSP